MYRDVGVVKRFFGDRGYGFVARVGAPDLFLHIRAFRNPIATDDIKAGMQIEFTIESSENGLRAADAVILPEVRL